MVRANLLEQVVAQTQDANARQIHIRFEGRSSDIPQSELDIGEASTDDQIRQAVATHLGVPPNKLLAFALDKTANGNITLRPEAQFGR
jgi:hypothetical protein